MVVLFHKTFIIIIDMVKYAMYERQEKKGSAPHILLYPLYIIANTTINEDFSF